MVVVLGHSNCGAVQATLEELGRPAERRSRNLRSIVDRIRPGVEALLQTGQAAPPPDLAERAVRANISASAIQLRHGSEILEDLIARDGLLVVGAEIPLETGVVDFFDGRAAGRIRARPSPGGCPRMPRRAGAEPGWIGVR